MYYVKITRRICLFFLLANRTSPRTDMPSPLLRRKASFKVDQLPDIVDKTDRKLSIMRNLLFIHSAFP